MPFPYGATFDDVTPLLPHRRWTPGTKPDQGDVEQFLTSVGEGLGIIVDPAPPGASPEVVLRLTALAKRATVLGAASHAEAAGTPERARPNETSSYAEWLWDRYLEAVELAQGFYADVLTGEVVVGAGDVDAEPAWAFPDPVGWAARGI